MSQDLSHGLRLAPPLHLNPDINAPQPHSRSNLTPNTTTVRTRPRKCLSSLGRGVLAPCPTCPTRCNSSSTSTSAISRASTLCVASAWPRKHPAIKSRTDPLQRKDELEYWLTEHLRLNGLYWGMTALHLLGHPDALPRSELLDFVFSCLHENGGFGAAPGHDAHMLYTVSGVQILATLDAFAELEERVEGGREKIGKCEFCSVISHTTSMLTVHSHRRPARSQYRHVRRR
jgi:hypothetical protein